MGFEKICWIIATWALVALLITTLEKNYRLDSDVKELRNKVWVLSQQSDSLKRGIIQAQPVDYSSQISSQSTLYSIVIGIMMSVITIGGGLISWKVITSKIDETSKSTKNKLMKLLKSLK